MNSIAVLAVIVFGALVAVMAYGGPTYAQQTNPTVTNSGTAVDSVVSAGSSIPVQLVRRGGGMGRSFHGGRAHGFRHFGRIGSFLGAYYPYFGDNYYVGCGEGCYEEGNKTCVWNGYKYRCYITSDEFY
jgi:hypothetical protein